MKTLEETFEYLEKFEGIGEGSIPYHYSNDNFSDYGVSLSKDYIDMWLDLFGENDTSIRLTFNSREKFVKYSGGKPLLPKKEDLEDVLNYFLRLKTSDKQREIDRTKANLKKLEERLKELEGE